MNQALKKNQVYEKLRRQILSGQLGPGDQLPGEFALADQLGVSCVTLRSSMRMLEEAGLIYRVSRKGTFISQQITPCNYMIIAPAEHTIGNPIPAIVQGMDKEAAVDGYKIISVALEFIRGQTPDDFSALLKQHLISGIFLMVNNFNGDEPEIRLLKQISLPVILPHGTLHDRSFFNCPIILSDIKKAFADGVKHLILQGHRRIAALGMAIDGTCQLRGFSSQEFLDFLSSQGASADPSLLCYAESTEENIRKNLLPILKSPDSPTAIICYSDFVAIHIYKILNELGIKIPEDISVMGFCGYSGGLFMSPPLSTVDLMYEQIGRDAVLLMQKSREWFPYTDIPLTIFSPHRLQIRQSTSENMPEFAKVLNFS